MGKLQQQQVEESAQLKSTPTFFATNPKASKRFKRVCVFCGSSSGNGTVYSNVALNLGRELVERNINLVYGGGNIGLMGQVAQMVHNSGGDVVGVIPKALIGPNLAGHTVGESVIVTDMHQRKAEMARRSDAFIALPGGYGRSLETKSLTETLFQGGYGTLEELLEVITWSQLRIHDKPIGLLNVDGYYDSLLTLFDNMQAQGFLEFNARTLVVSAPTPAELLDKLEAYTTVLDRSMPKPCWDAQDNQLDIAYIPSIPSRVQ